MSKIRSIADEIRERIKTASEEPKEKDAVSASAVPPVVPTKSVSSVAVPESHPVFEQLAAFRMEGNQKIMVRLDEQSMKLLKQLKFTRDIDMTKVIVFALHKFLQEHSWLQGHVLELLKSQNYEME